MLVYVKFLSIIRILIFLFTYVGICIYIYSLFIKLPLVLLIFILLNFLLHLFYYISLRKIWRKKNLITVNLTQLYWFELWTFYCSVTNGHISHLRSMDIGLERTKITCIRPESILFVFIIKCSISHYSFECFFYRFCTDTLNILCIDWFMELSYKGNIHLKSIFNVLIIIY